MVGTFKLVVIVCSLALGVEGDRGGICIDRIVCVCTFCFVGRYLVLARLCLHISVPVCLSIHPPPCGLHCVVCAGRLQS